MGWLEWAAALHLEQDALLGRRIIQYLNADCFGLSEIRQQSHAVIKFWPLHGHSIPGSPLEVFAARSPAERVPACKPMICLTRLDQFTPVHDVRLGLVPFKDAIQKPNNETVRQQNEHAHQTRPMPEMTDF